MRFVLKWTVLIACSTRRPLMRSRTSFAFCGLVRWNLASARNSLIFSTAFAIIFVLQKTSSLNMLLKFVDQQLLRLCGGLSGTCGVALERTRGGKFTEL